MYSVEHDGAGRNGMNEAGGVAIRLASLSTRLASARQSDRDRYESFFTTLGARMDGARAVERELDRLLARRFNALDYLRTDELGLSRIVGDLLDPGGAHGQGACFLARFGELVGPDLWPADRAVRYDDLGVRVVRERRTDGGGRLDISIELQAPGRKPACIAIENKPYAADGEAQVVDYLKFLRGRYDRRFLLIYLSGHGGMPSELSLPRDACKDGLAIMSFCPHATAGEYQGSPPLRLSFSLSDWLRECRQMCDAERLRWFLREVETFCHRTFGGIVTTASERKEVRDFILAADDNVRTAIAVVEAWPETRDEVVKRFLKVLRDRIRADLHTIGDLQIGAGFKGAINQPKNGVWAFRKAWAAAGDATPLVCINHEREANGWFVAVCVDPDTGETKARDDLKERLRECLRRHEPNLGGNFKALTWSWYRYLEEHADWRPLLACLHREVQEPGELTAYFSRHFSEAATPAIRIIDELLAGRQ